MNHLRKCFLSLCLVFPLCGFGGHDDSNERQDDFNHGLYARTESGTVKGIKEGQVVSFKSIPYAAPPVGALRFRPPQAPRQWLGVRDATKFRGVCPQIKDSLEVYAFSGNAVSNELTNTQDEFYENEDCLHVNVWTPAVDHKKRPVMLFIHGGAFQVGTASTDVYNGKNLAANDAVVMTINYRLGLFGFMELGKVDPSYAGSGNNGLRDQIAALKWARRNAESFGGDPDNITVFGESAGSMSVSALMSTKSPRSLFKRAIGQSGGPNLLHTREFAENGTNIVLQFGPKKTISDLVGASTRDLLKQQESAIYNYALGDSLFAPFLDEKLIIGNPYDLIAAGNARGVDLMVGANQDEMNYWNLYDSQLRNMFVQTSDFGPPIELISQAKRDFINASIAPLNMDAIYANWIAQNAAPLNGRTLEETIHLTEDHDFQMIIPMTRWAEKQASVNPNTYLYRLQWKLPRSLLSSDIEDLGAVHALDLPFVFGTYDSGLPVPGADKLLADSYQRSQAKILATSMMKAWTNFARTGNPNGPSVPAWPKFNINTRTTMLWKNDPYGNITSKAANDPDAERRKVWNAWSFPLYLWPLP